VTLRKRIFDVIFASVLMLFLGPVMMIIAAWLMLRQGRPVFFRAERMKSPDHAFTLFKFRSMVTSAQDCGVTGGEKHTLFTRDGGWLRHSRLDELPQLWNILKGDISFVGPRPPMRAYVERFPQVYQAVLKNRPGVTGLATLVFHRHEERLLSQTRSEVASDAVYVSRCLHRKARIDLIYQSRACLMLDMFLIAGTALKVIGIYPSSRVWRLTHGWKHDSTKPMRLGRENAKWQAEFF